MRSAIEHGLPSSSPLLAAAPPAIKLDIGSLPSTQMLHNWYGPVRVSISRTTFVTLRSGSTFSAFWQSNCCMLITPPPEEPSPLHSMDSQNSDKLKARSPKPSPRFMLTGSTP